MHDALGTTSESAPGMVGTAPDHAGAPASGIHPTPNDILAPAIDAYVGEASPGAPVLVASDFDGVLAPLVDDPLASRPLPEATAALVRLAALGPAAPLALVSGRDLATLASLASPPPGTHLIGSHGAEQGFINPDGSLEHTPLILDAANRARLDALIEGLEEIAAARPGAWVELKPAAAVLHTRLADPADALSAGPLAHDLGKQLDISGLTGKDVIEFALMRVTKGDALTALRDRLGARRVAYFGDDVTDEHAFALLGIEDFTVHIGGGPSAARFRVASPESAVVVLADVATALERHVATAM